MDEPGTRRGGAQMREWHPGALLMVPAGHAKLDGMLEWPEEAIGVVVLATCDRLDDRPPRAEPVARTLHAAGFATLVIGLLTRDAAERRETCSDVDLLTARLAEVVRYLKLHPGTAPLPVAVFGVDAAAAAALRVAAELPWRIGAVVSAGDCPDRAGEEALARVRAPTLLIVGADDAVALGSNQAAHRHLTCDKRLATVAAATQLFAEPRTLNEVSRLAADWLARHLRSPARGRAPLGPAAEAKR
jgi:pimeloyl-ACP methyl ester carboxylesterase